MACVRKVTFDNLSLVTINNNNQHGGLESYYNRGIFTKCGIC